MTAGPRSLNACRTLPSSPGSTRLTTGHPSTQRLRDAAEWNGARLTADTKDMPFDLYLLLVSTARSSWLVSLVKQVVGALAMGQPFLGLQIAFVHSEAARIETVNGLESGG
ncbi:hypothetical protein PI124_g18092 [Phytophthora idaei]|nr:hypothetical protein PI125_g26733 [Phytophthora idaei]KAG3125311.1 hypothetical protein PI126_g22826 [Phytophthora idaei]KAG3236908.1 hypothetical protein PI124_g18092 [Phytophthora idaei]